MKVRPKPIGATARPGFVRQDWHHRVNPAFLQYWSLKKKQGWGGTQTSDEDKNSRKKKSVQSGSNMAAAARELDGAASKLTESVWGLLQSAILKPLDAEPQQRNTQQNSSGDNEGVVVYAVNPELSAFFRKLVFLKYGITFPELIWQVDVEKRSDAHRKLMAVHKDYWRVQTGQGFRDLKLKFSWDHFDMIAHGLDFGFDRLDHYELAECLDEICPFGQPKHSPEYVKKLRTQMKKAWKRTKDTRPSSHLGPRYPL